MAAQGRLRHRRPPSSPGARQPVNQRSSPSPWALATLHLQLHQHFNFNHAPPRASPAVQLGCWLSWLPEEEGGGAGWKSSG
jgi:hypothetical protein